MTTKTGEGALAAARTNVKEAWGNANVRRVQTAFAGSEMGEWAYAMAILVWAYQSGGAALVGTWAGIRLLLSAISAPIGGMIADRMSRKTFMIANSACRVVLASVVALGMGLDLSIWLVLIAGTLHEFVGSSFRPTQAGFLPSLVTTPRQLTAANATAEIVDSSAAFVGPALAGVLLTLFGPVAVVVLNALGYVWSILLLSRVRPEAVSAADEEGEQIAEADSEGLAAEVVGGFKAIAGDRDLFVVTLFLFINGLLTGVLGVLVVLIAAEWLGDANAVGWMNAVLGGAIVIGSLLVLSLAGRVRLGRLMVIGNLGWVIPLAALGVVPEMVVVVLVLVVIGMSDPMINIGLGTIPQRIAPSRLLARVFAAIDSAFIVAAALGAFFTPILVNLIGMRWTVATFAALGGVLTLAGAFRVPTLDSRLAAPRGLELLREASVFAPLNPVVLEQIAHRLELLELAGGQIVVREGGTSDRFFLIESGEVLVSIEGREVRREGAGEVFGEIGLLRNVPRTATVTAVTDVVLLALSREDFLGVLRGDSASRAMAQDLVTSRL